MTSLGAQFEPLLLQSLWGTWLQLHLRNKTSITVVMRSAKSGGSGGDSPRVWLYSRWKERIEAAIFFPEDIYHCSATQEAAGWRQLPRS